MMTIINDNVDNVDNVNNVDKELYACDWPLQILLGLTQYTHSTQYTQSYLHSSSFSG